MNFIQQRLTDRTEVVGRCNDWGSSCYSSVPHTAAHTAGTRRTLLPKVSEDSFVIVPRFCGRVDCKCPHVQLPPHPIPRATRFLKDNQKSLNQTKTPNENISPIYGACAGG